MNWIESYVEPGAPVKQGPDDRDRLRRRSKQDGPVPDTPSE